MTRIIIADDHAVVQEGLKQLLSESLPHVEFVFATTIPETLALLRKENWNMLLLDLFMPGGNGFSVLRELRMNHPQLPTLVLSSAPEEQLGLRVLRAGANGYLAKQCAPEHLVQAVCKVLGGGKYVSAILCEQLAVEAGRANHPLHENLSDREYQVLHLVVEGRCLKDIANELSLSVKTVRTFHVRIFEKLRLQSDVDLVHYALDHGLVEKRVSPRSPPDLTLRV